MPRLLEFAAEFEHRLPLAVGYVWRHHINRPDLNHVSGGAGILFSQAAVTRIVPQLYTAVCPFDTFQDDTLSRCAQASGVLLLHDSRWKWHGRLAFLTPGADQMLYHDALSAITSHYLDGQTMVAISDFVYSNEARWLQLKLISEST